MIIFGIIVTVGAASICGLLIADNFSTTPIYTPHLLDHPLPGLSAVAIFCAGMGVAFLLCFGVWLFTAGVIDRHRGARWNEPVDDFLPGQWHAP